MGNIDTASDRLQALAPEIAKELTNITGETYTAKTLQDADGVALAHHVDLISSVRGIKLGLSVAYRSGNTKGERVHVSGYLNGYVDGKQVWYANSYQGEVNPEASVSLSKSPRQIATDIARRILPGYLELLAKCQDAKFKYSEEAFNAFKAAQRLAQIIGAKVDARNASEPSLAVYGSKKLPEHSFDVKVGVNQVSFNRLQVSPEVAAKILQLLVDSA